MTGAPGSAAIVPDELIRNVPLFDGIGSEQLNDFIGVFQRVSFAKGAFLMRQGQVADSAFIVEIGEVEVITALPGGGQATVAVAGPGSVLGEMALLDSGVRSASAIARAATAGYLLERDAFRMLLAQRNRTVFEVQRRITLMLCGRLRELNAKIVANSVAETNALPERAPQGAPRAQRNPCAFDYRAFLPILPVFRRFSAADIDGLAAQATVFDVPRGQAIFRQGDPSDTCYILVRGAIELITSADGQRRRIGVLGPGRLCGVLGLIDGEPHSMTALAREQVTLMEIDGAAFRRIYDDHSALASKFHDAINQELLQSLARTNNHLTRLISQACIHNRAPGTGRKVDVEELQRALCSQISAPSAAGLQSR